MTLFPSGSKKLKGMEQIQLETICTASFKGVSSVFVWVLWHQTRAQHPAGANTSAVAEAHKVSMRYPS